MNKVMPNVETPFSLLRYYYLYVKCEDLTPIPVSVKFTANVLGRVH